MSDAFASHRSLNLGLVVALVVLVVGGGLLAAGPGSDLLDRLEVEVDGANVQLEKWGRERAAFLPISGSERKEWAQQWEEFERRIQPVADDPSLVARVAAQLEAPSVSRFEVQRRSVAAAGDDADGNETALIEEPFGDRSILITEVPLRVTLRANYRDTVEILNRIESGALPVRIESLDIKRDLPGLQLNIDLTYFTRAKASDADAAEDS